MTGPGLDEAWWDKAIASQKPSTRLMVGRVVAGVGVGLRADALTQDVWVSEYHVDRIRQVGRSHTHVAF